MRLEIYRNILSKLSITEEHLFSINENYKKKYFINDEIPVTGVEEEIHIYKKKAEKINNKDRTLMDQAEALKLANEQIGKLIDMNMKLIETITELNKKIDMKMILVFAFIIMSFSLQAQCKDKPKSRKGDNAFVIVAENAKDRLYQYFVSQNVKVDTLSGLQWEYMAGDGYVLGGNVQIHNDSLVMRCNYTFDKKNSSLQLVVEQRDSNGPAYDVNIFNNIHANVSWDLFKCLMKNVPGKFIKVTDVVKF